GPESSLELLGRELGQVFDLVLFGGIVDEDVEPAEFPDRLLDGSPAEFLVANIALDAERMAALALDQFDRLPRVCVLLEIDEGDIGPFPRHRDGAGATDPAVAAGDEGDATGEPVGTDKTRRVVRRRLHLVLSAGLTLLFLRRLQALLAVSALRFPGGLAARCSIRIGHGIMLRFELPCV